MGERINSNAKQESFDPVHVLLNLSCVRQAREEVVLRSLPCTSQGVLARLSEVHEIHNGRHANNIPSPPSSVLRYNNIIIGNE